MRTYRVHRYYQKELQETHLATITQQHISEMSNMKAPVHASISAERFIVTPETVADWSLCVHWHMDFGAIDHFVSDLSQFSLSSRYNSSQHLHVGSGECLSISHTGYISSPTTLSNNFLHLVNVLCLPKVIKNLLSVAKLTRENNVKTEFHPEFCLVKDRDTNVILMQGVFRNGLYQPYLYLTCSKMCKQVSDSIKTPEFRRNSNLKKLQNLALQSNNLDPLVWHKCLGHPCKQTLKLIFQTCEFSTKVPFWNSFLQWLPVWQTSSNTFLCIWF